MNSEHVQKYLHDLEEITRRDDIQNYDTFITEVTNNPEQLPKSANEADRAVYYAKHGRTVVVEPDSENRIDLKTVDSEGNIEWIELKRISSSFDQQDFVSYLIDTGGKFRKANKESDISTSNGNTVLEFHLTEGSSVDMRNIDKDSEREEIEAGIKRVLRTRRDNGVDPPLTDVVRVYMGDGDDPIVIETDEIYTNQTNGE